VILQPSAVKYFGVGSNLVLDALEDADAAPGLSLSAEVYVGGVGADYGDALVLGLVERQQMLVVLQKGRSSKGRSSKE